MNFPARYLTTISLIIFAFLSMIADDADSITTGKSHERYSRLSPLELTHLAYSLLGNEDFEESLIVNEVILMRTEGAKDRAGRGLYVNALDNIGCIYLFEYQNHEKAYQYFLKAKKLAKDYDFPGLLGSIYDNIAKIYADFGAADEAMHTYSEAFRQSVHDTVRGSDDIRIMTFNDMSNFAVSQDRISDIKESLEVFKTLTNVNAPMGKYSKRLSEALLKLLDGNYKESISILKGAYALIDHPIGRTRFQTEHLLTLATIYHMSGMQDEALESLYEAMSIAKDNNQGDLYARIYRGMSKVEAAIGNQERADKYRLQEYLTKDSLYAIKAYTKIVSLEPSLKIDSLTNEMREAEINHIHRLRLLWVMGVAIALILVLLMFVIRRSRKLASSYKSLAEKHNESVRQQESASKMRKEYEEVIVGLHREIDMMREEAVSPSAGSIESKSKTGVEAHSDKQVYVPVSEIERLKIIGVVNQVMEESEEVYSSEFSLERLSEITATKPRYLSTLINESFGKTFSELTGEVRIKKACEMLLSPDFKKTLTLESVATSVGYRSRTHFNSVFKKVTGLTPTQYIASMK